MRKKRSGVKTASQEKDRKQNTKNSIVLVVLDGWGIAESGELNAISAAKKPNFEQIQKEFGMTEVCASGTCVGLTDGQMGNSEVGHLTIGAGRIIVQDLMRVHEEIKSGQLAKNPTLLASLRSVKKRNGTVHFMGLLSEGGVHSHIDHLFALLRIAKDNGIDKVVVHAFLDGRDTPPRSGVDRLAELKRYLGDLRVGTIGTLSGRYYAMDRDNRWDRTKLAYDAIVYGKGEKFDDAIDATKKSYESGVDDEFVVPEVERSYRGLSSGDLVIFYNFRPDRARQLTKALSFDFEEFGSLFDRNESARPKDIDIITTTVYDPKFKKVKALLER
ncbi:MAG: 2,3-bisphosphoglycerate-independent phosphoglycerate mutase [Nitrososphaerales archaeon]